MTDGVYRRGFWCSFEKTKPIRSSIPAIRKAFGSEAASQGVEKTNPISFFSLISFRDI